MGTNPRAMKDILFKNIKSYNNHIRIIIIKTVYLVISLRYRIRNKIINWYVL